MEAGWPPLFVLTDQGASLIAVSIDVMRDLIKNGEIPFVKNGHRYTIDRCDLDKWIEGKKKPRLLLTFGSPDGNRTRNLHLERVTS